MRPRATRKPSDSGVDRLSHSSPASSGASQHGAWRPAISSRTAAATSGPQASIWSPWAAPAMSSISRVNQPVSGSTSAR